MVPALHHGDLLLGYRWGVPQVGRVAIIRRDYPLVKRLVRHAQQGWWIEGDNLADSSDSRQFGHVAASAIEAIVIWPRR